MQIEKNADKLVKTLRVFIQDQPGYLGRLCTAIGEAGGNIGEVLKRHEGGKIAVTSRYPLESIADMRKVYTPGVATVCRLIQANPPLAYRYTAIGNLEDVAAPDCFEIEARIQDALDIPVMHDDQHGTAVVVLASLLRGCALNGLSLADQTVGIIGLGAAGMGIAKLLLSYGIRHLIGTDLHDPAGAGHPGPLQPERRDPARGSPGSRRGLCRGREA